MADTQITPLGDVTAPADWTLSDAQVVTIASLFAHFNGAGAAGDFVPTVEIVSDAGKTVLKVPQDTTVAAGASADASWAPFLRTSAAAVASGLDYAQVVGDYIPLVNVAATPTGTNFTYINTNAPAVFTITASNLYIHADGAYVILLDQEIEAGGVALTATQVQLENTWLNNANAQLGISILGAAGITEQDTSTFGVFGLGVVSSAMLMVLSDAATFGPFKAAPTLYHNHGSNGRGYASFGIVKVV